jgi:hypothetical protein
VVRRGDRHDGSQPNSRVRKTSFMARLARRVLAVPATSASPESLFSTAGNEMTKKRTRLTCDNLETL